MKSWTGITAIILLGMTLILAGCGTDTTVPSSPVSPSATSPPQTSATPSTTAPDTTPTVTSTPTSVTPTSGPSPTSTMPTVTTSTPPGTATATPTPTPEPSPTPQKTTSPLALEDIIDIVPLGNLNPSSHTFPTNHIYFYPPRRADETGPIEVSFYAPGDMTVTGLRASHHVNAGVTDFDFEARVCDGVSVRFGHVTTLRAEIFGDTTDFSGWHLENEYETGGEIYRSWVKEVDIPLSAGELLGTAGGNPGQWALDMWAYDTRIERPVIAAPERLRPEDDQFYVVCPLAYFEPGPVLDGLVARVSRDPVEGEDLPCGTIYYDVPGTAQGLWFLEGTEGYPREDEHLALVPHNIRTANLAFSVGLSVPGLPSGVYEFLPQDSGRLNRAFTDVTADGQIYAYQVGGYSGVIIIAMPDETTLRIEALPSGTTNPASWVFTGNAVTFER